MLSYENNSIYARRYSLKDFSYNEFDSLSNSRDASDVRYPNYWEFLLLLSILSSIEQDSLAESSIPDLNLKSSIKYYRESKILYGKDIGDFVKSVKNYEVKFGIPYVAQVRIGETATTKIPTREELFDGLKRLCYSLKTPNQHIIIIDDLDYVLTERKRQNESLMALIIAADKINKMFREKQVKIKIVVLCRTDVFDKLSGTNKTKIVTDTAIYLDWYQNVINVMDTNIVKIINLRAKLSLGRDVNVFTEYFPPNFVNDNTSDKINLKSVLTWTRHTPRDAIQLMNNIKLYVDGEFVTKENIKNGLRSYAMNYFYGEIRDELKGFLSDDEVNLAFQLLSSMGYSNFRYSDVEMKIKTDSRFKKVNLAKVFDRLYECNAIGNYDENNSYSSWKYRNRYSSFDPNKIINVHTGLAKALNIHSYNPNLRKNTAFDQFQYF